MRLETKQRACTVLGLAFLVMFLLFTYMVMKYDAAPVGFGGSVIGFSRFNTAFHELFPGDKGCYAASETLGYICLMLAGANAIIAIADFIRHRGKIFLRCVALGTTVFPSLAVMLYQQITLFGADTDSKMQIGFMVGLRAMAYHPGFKILLSMVFPIASSVPKRCSASVSIKTQTLAPLST